MRKIIAILFISTFVQGCSILDPEASPTSAALAGGLGGAVIGGGIGGVVGSIISNGDIVRSALLGAAIGAPLGVVAARETHSNQVTGLQSENLQKMKSNQMLINSQERDIEDLRALLEADRPVSQIDAQPTKNPYTGATLGNPIR
ncbi:MAG TPA: hypothetical protein PKD37_00955 [Oligoflexia bacterium]|nr:hypothetical protein [Oligoflexia bacterium]HMP26548.1 hypothetical protein [Oligoflexia bacterium]